MASYVIVGGGVFGVSTAYHLIKKYPEASITIVDRDPYDADSRVAASWDWNKVIRADYDDIVYCQLALEAYDIYKSDPLWQPYFHETGIYWICRSDHAQKVIANYQTLKRDVDIQALSISEARKLYDGLFEDADYDGVKEVLVNRTSGWAAASDCLRAVTEECLRLGVEYKVAEVESLCLNDKGICTGVRTSRSILTATHTILATGAYTPKLLGLAAEASGRDELRTGDRIVAGGIATGMTTLDEESYSRFKRMPVGIQGYTPQVSPSAGSLPPTRERELKWWSPIHFKNTQEITPGHPISTPPSQLDYAQWEVSTRLKADIDRARTLFYGEKSASWKMEKYRICW